MNYEPVYETVVDAGEYYFKIAKSAEGMTKTGKPSLRMTLNVWNDAGAKNTVYWQTLLEFSDAIRKVSKATGLLEAYEGKTLEAHDFIGKTGKCDVEVEENALYEKRNVIKNFKARVESAEVKDDLAGQDVPF